MAKSRKMLSMGMLYCRDSVEVLSASYGFVTVHLPLVNPCCWGYCRLLAFLNDDSFKELAEY